MLKPLGKLNPGEQGRVERVNLSAGAEDDLRRLGFSEGAQVRCLRYCPLKGPGLYQVRGTVLSLRREDGGNILVRTSSNETGTGGF